jgi:YggT family protein
LQVVFVVTRNGDVPAAYTRRQGRDVVAIFSILIMFLNIMTFAIIGRAISSWFDPRVSNPVSRFLFDFTEPIVGPIRAFMPRMGMIDLSPLIAILLIRVLIQVLSSAVNA